MNTKEKEKSLKLLEEQFQKVVSRLHRKPWFKKGKWLFSIHAFPPKKPVGVTLQIFKSDWFNDDGQGIHVESYLDLNLTQRRRSYVALHLLHHSKIPGTQLKRIAFTKPFMDEVFAEIKTWKGYKIRAGKYGSAPFSKVLDGTESTFVKELEIEIARICCGLSPALNRALGALPKMRISN